MRFTKFRRRSDNTSRRMATSEALNIGSFSEFKPVAERRFSSCNIVFARAVDDSKVESRCCKMQRMRFWQRATQTVFGEGLNGPNHAQSVSNPGTRKTSLATHSSDQRGKYWKKLLSLQEYRVATSTSPMRSSISVGLPRERGKRRIHKKPRYSEIRACRPWLEAEIAVTRPQVIVCLGPPRHRRSWARFQRDAAARPVCSFPLAPRVMGTVHPSSILRAPDQRSRHEQKNCLH